MQTIEEECPCGGTNWPSDFFVIDLTDAAPTLVPITTQPDGARTFEQTKRSRPIWSPNGGMIAWTEGVEVGDLYVYDFMTDETHLLAEGIPAQNLVSSPVDILLWTDAGIVIENVEYDDDLNPMPSKYTVYGLDDRVIEASVLHGAEDTRVLAYDGETPLLLSHEASLSLQTGAVIATPPAAELLMVAASNRETSLRVGQPVIDAAGGVTRQVFDADGTLLHTLVTAPGENLSPVSLSSSGRTLFTGRDGTILSFWRTDVEGGPYTIDTLPWEPDAILWGRHTFVIQARDVGLIARGRCEGTNFSFRLTRGREGYVADSTPNNVRAAPGADAELIGQIPAGDWFTRTDSSLVCADGFTWLEVEYGDLTGWTAEAGPDGYWLAPGCPPGGCVRG